MEREIDMTGVKMTEEAAERAAVLKLVEDDKFLIIQKIALQPQTKTAKITYDYRPLTPKELEWRKEHHGQHPNMTL
ncbi:hypothetical protein NN484_07945 [Pseudomonas serboccidentalis]|uniref:Uncharacterized protein n=1 Tax=Pseudomonas serboccidentalis TaxID=2964670 RepID=A0ABY7ZEG8_9PSED|nr:hypothetical protein [Pseudomonas serboccidentalis]WDR37655.1 hypothetical protein NN484_07945 [Pseudomonas serboccidentalis]